MDPSGVSAKVTYAFSRCFVRQRAMNVSYCQCSRSPTNAGERPNRRTSRPFSKATLASPYSSSRYDPAYLASGRDGRDAESRSARSEERRVGKEGRSRGARDSEKKKRRVDG